MSSFLFDNQKNSFEEALLPMMSLREVVMFPRSIAPLFVGREASIKAIEQAVAAHDKKIFLVAQRSPETEKPTSEDLFEMGTVSKILQMLRLPDGTIKVLFEGLYRAEWESETMTMGEDANYPMVTVRRVPEEETHGPESLALLLPRIPSISARDITSTCMDPSVSSAMA